MNSITLRWFLVSGLVVGVLGLGLNRAESGAAEALRTPDPVPDRDSLLARRGLPDLRVPWPLNNGDTGYLYLYEGVSTGESVDRAYLLNARGTVRAGYVEYDADTDHEDSAWYKETIEDMRAWRDHVRGLRDQTNAYLGSLPGLNYFDQTELDHDSLVLRLNSAESLPRTTITLKPGDRSLYVGFEILFGE